MKVNYNVTGNDRKALVKVIGETIGVKPKYLGMPSAAFQIGNFTVSKTGELEYEDGSDTETVLEAIAAAGFTAETDMTEKHEEATDAQDEVADAEIDGLTIDMPRGFYSDAALNNLKKLVESKATLIKQAVGSDELSINVTEERVSFPWFNTQDADEAKAYAEFISKLSIMAKEATRVTATDHAVENPKYAMRCFLLRLGFIGAEYKQSRKILLKNLSGNSSWKNGRKEEASDEISE